MYHYPLVSTAQHNLTPTTYTPQHQQQTAATEQQQNKYTGPPIVSVKEKLEAPDAEENPKQYNNSGIRIKIIRIRKGSLFQQRTISCLLLFMVLKWNREQPFK